MAEIPSFIGDARVLAYALVTPSVEPKGFTRHIVNGIQIEPAAALAVARYPDPSSGYYLFYLDSEGTVVTDTWHDSPVAAQEQAALEYADLTWADLSAT